MIDLHTHSLLSDGELLPSELIRRAEAVGYQAIAITDHIDTSNYDFVLPRLIRVCKRESKRIIAIPGIEITHVCPEDISSLASECRKMGAKIIIVHGETIVEPVAQGTNLKALKSDIDILAHPGILTEREALLARDNGIMLEITSRKGHCLANGHVVSIAKKTGACLVLNTDAHSPQDLISLDMAKKVAIGAGLNLKDFNQIRKDMRELLNKVI